MEMTEYKRKYENKNAEFEKLQQKTAIELERLSAFRLKVPAIN
jgi:hypothetical protein